jgi:hypothetical protein
MAGKHTALDQHLASQVMGFAGRAAHEPGLQGFLTALGHWPLAPFPPDEFDLYVEDRDRGFALSFRNAAALKHPAADGKPAGTAILVGTFFYSQGKDGYQQFEGALPRRLDRPCLHRPALGMRAPATSCEHGIIDDTFARST